MKRIPILFAIGAVLALGCVDASFAQEHSSASEDKSQQPVTDAWITTKVKDELLMTKGIASGDISVTTTNGMVTLSGTVDSKSQLDRSTAAAKAVKGVHGVDATALRSRE